jgi:hypothetical protein
LVGGRPVPEQSSALAALHKSARYRLYLAGYSDPVANVMAHLWRIRLRSWTLGVIRRVADLPFQFAVVRRIRRDDFPKLDTI